MSFSWLFIFGNHDYSYRRFETGFAILASIASRFWAEVELFGFLRVWFLFFNIWNKTFYQLFAKSDSAGEITIWIAAASSDAILAKAEVIDDRGSVAKSLKVFKDKNQFYLIEKLYKLPCHLQKKYQFLLFQNFSFFG